MLHNPILDPETIPGSFLLNKGSAIKESLSLKWGRYKSCKDSGTSLDKDKFKANPALGNANVKLL